MASVRITNNLRDEISTAAEKAYQLANPKPEASTEFISLTKQAIQNSPQQKYLRHCLEKGVEMGIDKQNNGEALMPKKVENVTSIRLERDVESDWCEIKFNTPVEYLSKENTSWYRDTKVYIDNLALQDQSEILDLFLKLVGDNKEHTSNAFEYRRSINQLLTKCTTLKQLFEIWPAAESLVDQKYIQKMHTKVTRVKRAEQIKEEINFDPTIANQAVLTAKMLGA